jgi:signal peptidase I
VNALAAAVTGLAAAGMWSAARLLARRLVLVTVRGQSMVPAYRDGERVLVRRAATCQRGDVVVFRMPDDRGLGELNWLVKRVAAIAGERVPDEFRRAITDPVVPAGQLVVRGDSQRSLDSRQLGCVPTADMLGVVISPVRADPAHPRPRPHLRHQRGEPTAVPSAAPS